MKIKKICSQILAITLLLVGFLSTTVSVAAEDIIRLQSTFTMEEHNEGSEIIFRADLDSVQAYKLADNTQVITGLKPILLQDCKLVLTDGTNYVYSKNDGTWIESTDYNTAKNLAEVISAGKTIDLTYFTTPSFPDYNEYVKADFDSQILYILMDDDTTYGTPLTDLFYEFFALGASCYTAYDWSYVAYETGIYVGHLSEGLRVELKYFSNIVIQEGTAYDVTENNSTNMVLTGEDKITNVLYDNNKAEMQIYYELGKLTDLNGTKYENSVSNIEIYGPNIEIGSYSIFKSNENGVITIENIILPEKGTYRILLDTPYMSYVSNYVLAEYELVITEDDLSEKPIEEDYIDIEIDFRSNTEPAKLKLTSHFGNSYIYTFNGEQINTEPSTSVIVEVNQNGEFEYKAKTRDNTITGYYLVSCFSNETLETMEEPEIIEAEPLEDTWITNIVEKLWQTGLYDNFDFKTVGIICILSGIALILIPNQKVRKIFGKKESK